MYSIFNMTYREKTAWLSLGAMALTFGPYFTFVALNNRADAVHGMPDVRQLVTSPKDWRAPADERDLAILQRATSWGYYVLLTGMILVGCIVPFTAGGWTIVNDALFSIVVAEVVRHAVVVTSYRRQT